MTAFGDKYESVVIDISDGIDEAILIMDKLLKEIDPERYERIHDGYSDVFKNIEFSSQDNKEFLFEDLVWTLDMAVPPGWTFGPEETYSVIYRFMDDDKTYSSVIDLPPSSR